MCRGGGSPGRGGMQVGGEGVGEHWGGRRAARCASTWRVLLLRRALTGPPVTSWTSVPESLQELPRHQACPEAARALPASAEQDPRTIS